MLNLPIFNMEEDKNRPSVSPLLAQKCPRTGLFLAMPQNMMAIIGL